MMFNLIDLLFKAMCMIIKLHSGCLTCIKYDGNAKTVLYHPYILIVVLGRGVVLEA